MEAIKRLLVSFCSLSMLKLCVEESAKVQGATVCSPPCLLVSNTSDILAIDPFTSTTHSIISGLTRAVAIDVHFSLGYIFWSDVKEQNIKRSNIDGTNIVTLISNQIGVCDGLAVEWNSQNLYWSDTTYDEISVADLNGNNRRVLLSSGLDEPREIALDPANGLMFWTDWGQSPKIERASLSGSQRVAIVTTNLHWPNGIDIDKGNQRIFWVDAWEDRVESVNYNGNNRTLLYYQSGLHTFGVVFLPPFLFFTEWNTSDELVGIDATTGKVLKTYGFPGHPMGVVAYDSSRQPLGSSACSVSNGACSHFFVAKPTGRECVCPTGIGLNPDGKTCNEMNRCPLLSAPNHGRMTPCSNLPGGTCEFSCNQGYVLTGTASRTCSSNGVWTGTQPQCNDVLPPTFGVTCPESPLLVYAERGRFSALVNWTTPVAVDNSATTPTVTSNNQSPPERMNQGRHVILYTAKDSSGNTAICSFTIQVIVINCTLLDVPPGGPLRMSSCGNYYGATCSFTCASGFILNGSLNVTCVAPGNAPPGRWDNPLPTCQAVRCPSLPSPSNGVKTGCQNQTSERHNTVCSFTCNPGYNLIGSSARRCLLNGTWSGRTSTCQAIECASLVPPQFGAIKPPTCLDSRTAYGGTCTFTCASGYTLEGTSSRVCGDRGEWTGLNDTRCKDTSPPTFNSTCPSNMVFYTGPCKSRAVVYWKEPVAVDTSGTAIMTYPAVRPSVSLTVGPYYILYSASDKNGNTANCSFIVQVIRKSCPSLQPPLYGDIISLSCESSYGSQASLTCKRGYRLTGSRSRSCDTDGDWSGNTTICNAVKCARIKEPSNGIVFPGPCKSLLGVYYGTECHFMCDTSNGYRLEGPQNVTCHDSGTWSADTNKSVCQDIQPPILQCPPNMEIATETGQSYANVTWIVPVPTDNSNEALNLSGLSPPQQFNVGRTTVKYAVTDSAGLWSSCIFVVHVKDTEPPKFSSCPNDTRTMSGQRLSKIRLPPASFKDNVGVQLFVTNIQNGSKLTWGEYNVTYTATDKAGNTATCAFHLSITEIPCEDLTAPLNGAKACEVGILVGMHCTVHCNHGYGFAVQPQDLYICFPSGKWLHTGDKKPVVPDCSKAYKPQSALVNGELHYLARDCGGEEMNKDIADNFLELFMSHIFGAMGCENNQECTVENVRVECGAQTRRRRRRDSTGDTGTPLIDLTVHFALKVPLPSNSSKLDFNQTSQQLSNEIMVVLNQTNLDLNISGVLIQLDRLSPAVISLTRLLCEKGQVQRNTECVNCAVGYFYNASGDSCQPCVVDHYQNQEAQTSCVPCPAQKSTFGREASRWPQDCRERTNKSETENQGNWKVILISVVVSVTVAIVVILALLWKFCRRRNKKNSNSRPDDAYQLDDLLTVSEA